MIIRLFAAICLIFLSIGNGFANDSVDFKSIENAGFDNVSEILKQMSPEQLDALIKEAEALRPEVEGMSQQEMEQFTQQLLQMDSTIDPSKINVKELDPSKTKGLKDIKKDVDSYMQQHK